MLLYDFESEYDAAIKEAQDALASVLNSGVEESVSAADTGRTRKSPSILQIENHIRKLKRERAMLARGGEDCGIQAIPGGF